jgi:hypothetical protein
MISQNLFANKKKKKKKDGPIHPRTDHEDPEGK